MAQRITARQESDNATSSSSSRTGFWTTITITNGYGFQQEYTWSIGSVALTTTTMTDADGAVATMTNVLPSKSLTTIMSANMLGIAYPITRRITVGDSSATSTAGPSSQGGTASTLATIFTAIATDNGADAATRPTSGSGVGVSVRDARAQTPSAQPQPTSGKGGISGGVIAAAVVVPIVVIALLLLLGLFCLRRRKKRREQNFAAATRAPSGPEMTTSSTRYASPRPTIPDNYTETAVSEADYSEPVPAAMASRVQPKRKPSQTELSTTGSFSNESPLPYQHRGNMRSMPPAGVVSPTKAAMSGPPQLDKFQTDDWRNDDISRLTNPFHDPASSHSTSGTTSGTASASNGNASTTRPTSTSATPISQPQPSFRAGHQHRLSDVPSSGFASPLGTIRRGAPDDGVSVRSDMSLQDADVEVAEVAQARPTQMQRASVVQLTSNGNSPPRESTLPAAINHKPSLSDTTFR